MGRQGLEQRQGQDLALTAGMQQSLHILRMLNRDITALLHEEAARNPFLRLSGRRAPGVPDLALETAASAVSLGEHVATQVGLAFRDPFERAFAMHLVSALEPTGWLGRPLQELAEEMAVPPAQAESVLARMQEFEPAGLFARSLRECLQLQAQDAQALTPPVAAVLQRLELLAARNLTRLRQECGLDEGGLAKVLQLIRGFDPKPGLRFLPDVSSVLMADLRVISRDGTWLVEVNDAALPAIRVDDSPLKLAGRTEHRAPDYRAMRDLARQARDLHRMVSRRKETLLAVGAAIVARQQAFLRDGRMAMLPLSLSDIAEDTGFHISTISRAVSATLIETPKGSLPLRAFFTRSVEVGQGALVAQGSLAALIDRILAEEDKAHPLTDAEVASTIAAMGFSITGRTVGNHRKALGIPAAAERRHKKGI